MTNAPSPPAVPKAGGTRVPFPHHYEVRLEGVGAGARLLAPPSPELIGGAPATFGGRDDWWNPEHLLLASLGLCLKTTFDALAAKAALDVADYRSQARATLDKSAQGLGFTAFHVDVEVRVAAGDIERTRALLDSAQRWCLVSNALRVPVEVNAVVTAA